jgi:amino acid adenylation domain-containing protein
VAAVFGCEQITYRKLNIRANQLARFLCSRGVGPEIPVGVCLERSVEVAVAVLAVLKSGGAYVPLDPSYPAARLSFMLEDSAASVVLTERDTAARVTASGPEVVCMDDICGLTPKESAENPRRRARRENLAYIIYTSGSTGQPKGVAMPHRPLVNLLEWQRGSSPCGDKARTLQFASLSFDVACQEMFSAWHGGGSVVFIPETLRHAPDDFWAYLAEAQINRLFLPPVMLEELARVARDRPGARPPLLEVITAGETLRITPAIRDLFAGLPNCRLMNQYGPTETHVVTAHELTGQPTHWPELPPIGRPIKNARIFILDERLQPVATGVAGELCAAGISLARGYWKRPDLTAQRFVAALSSDGADERLYRTGDLCRRLPDDSIEFLGRLDHQVKIRGHRIETGEVEAALLRHAFIKECVVVAHGSDSDRHLVAYVVPGAPQVVSVQDLRKLLAQTLPDYMLPSTFVPLDALPRTPNGKIHREALPKPEGDKRPGGGDFVAPRSETERKLAAIWEESLEVRRVGLHDDFFELGGHSLKATRALVRILETFGVELTHRSFFEQLTVARMAAQIDRIRPVAPPVAEPLSRPVPLGAKLPLSWGQMEIWFTTQLAAGSPVYNEPFTVYLGGSIEVAALEKALRCLIRRHTCLRAGFVLEAGEPLQFIQQDAQMAFIVADLEALSPGERESQAIHRVTAMTRRPFDLSHPSLFRAMLARMDEMDYRLYLVFHHIIMDAFAVYHVFLPELWGLYEAFRLGQTPSLPKLSAQYSDYAQWQRERVSGSAVEKSRTYWRRQLAGVASLDLPADHRRPAHRTFRGAYQRLVLPKELTNSLNALARREQATLFMTLLAAFKALLARYTQTTDIAVGTVEAGRSRQQFEGLFGYFLNTLVLRTDLSGNPAFLELLRRVKEVTLAACAHADFPYFKLVQELQSARERSRNPLFQVAFVMEPSLPPQPSGWTVSQLETQNGAAKFDLTVELEERDEGVIGRFEYDRDLFEDATVARMIEHLCALLEGIAADPNRPFSMLPMLTESERALLLAPRSASTVTDTTNYCLHEWFEAQAERTPDAIAVCCEQQRLTYRQLNERANRLAWAIQKLGVGPGAMTPICAERTLEMVIGILGILKAGGAYVPLDPLYPKERLAMLIDDLHPAVLVVQRAVADKLPACELTLLFIEDALEAFTPARHENPQCGATPEDLAYVIYTSGSTGKPKGVMVTHRNVVRLFQQTQPWFGFGSNDVWTLFHSFAFDFSVWELWGALLYGGRLVIVPYWLSRSPEQFRDLLCDEKVTVLNQTPTAFRQLLRAVAATGLKKLDLRWIIFGGEALDLASLRPWFELYGDEKPQLVNMYGITETTVHVTYQPLRAADLDQVTGSVIGAPIPDLHVYLLDQQKQLVPIGVPGEIYVGGAGVARGYLNRPELTSERFIPNPFVPDTTARLYRSGDLARRLASGDLEYLGRIDDQVKIRGYRIELGEIAEILGQCPSVREAAVIARNQPDGDALLVAYVVPKPGADPATTELRTFLCLKLPDYMIPSAFVRLAALPLTPNGKLDRPALPNPCRGDSEPLRVFVAPRTSIEERLAGIWRDVLEVAQIGIYEDFFDLGGNSLLAMRVVSGIRNALGVETPIRALFENPTVAGLAKIVESLYVDSQSAADWAEVLRQVEALSDAESNRSLMGELGVERKKGSPLN